MIEALTSLSKILLIVCSVLFVISVMICIRDYYEIRNSLEVKLKRKPNNKEVFSGIWKRIIYGGDHNEK